MIRDLWQDLGYGLRMMRKSPGFTAVALLSQFLRRDSRPTGLPGTIWSDLVRVARRTNEIGIRLALGAAPGKVLSMVLKESLWLVVVGIVIVVPTTFALTRLISTRLFGVSAADPLSVGLAILLMIAVGALAAFIPARRAAGVDPLVALRYE